MSGWVKGLIGALAVGVLALGAVAGQALAQGGTEDDEQARPRQEEFLGRVAAELGVSVDALKDAIQSTELGMLNEAVDGGKVRPEVADRLRQRVEEGRLLAPLSRAGAQQPRLRPVARLALHAAAETVDMTPRELVGELRATGQSLAELAEGKGISPEELKSGILGDVQKHLDERLARLSENIDSIIDRTIGPAQAPPAQ